MLGAELQFNRSGDDADRFYRAATVRLIQDYLRVAQITVTSDRSHSKPGDSTPPEEKSKPRVPAASPSTFCNLRSFLESVTPSVAAQYFPKMKLRTLMTHESEIRPFFELSDLWESFKECSAYGIGVPLILNNRDCVVQYYVPYLSGIQLYVDLSRSSAKLRQLGEESDSEYSRDSCSDGTSDSDQDQGGFNYPWEHRNRIHTSDISVRIKQLSLREQDRGFQEGFSSDEGESGRSQICLLFEYLERAQPYCREPLANKISELARRFPELKTLRSCDLHPSSWLSVAWYPIYSIPTGPTLRDLNACFLTYHSLHTPLTGSETIIHTGNDDVVHLPLPVFGLASYKFKELLWTSNAEPHCQLARTLLQAADNWLSMLQVHHPDFAFFNRNHK